MGVFLNKLKYTVDFSLDSGRNEELLEKEVEGRHSIEAKGIKKVVLQTELKNVKVNVNDDSNLIEVYLDGEINELLAVKLEVFEFGKRLKIVAESNNDIKLTILIPLGIKLARK